MSSTVPDVLTTAIATLWRFKDGRWPLECYDVKQVCQRSEQLKGCFKVLIILPAKVDLSTVEQEHLSRAFDIPSSDWSQQYQKATGFFSADHQKSSNAAIERLTTSFRFLLKKVKADNPASTEMQQKIVYHWEEIGVWTRWRPSHSSALLLIIRDEGNRDKLYEDVQESLCTPDRYPDVESDHPFCWHAFILSHISRALDESVWACRDRIRHLEQNRPSTVPANRPHYQSMHEMARHTIHIAEVLSMSIIVVDNMIDAIEDFQEVTRSAGSGRADCTKALGIIRCQKTLLECSHGRAQALNSRLQNEINLAFHLGTERDSNNAAIMARSMQRDSIAMKTISVLGLVFLPGTFISAIFGMTFFDYTSTLDGWNVSPQFWIYWMVTIPVTLATWAVWQFLTRREMP